MFKKTILIVDDNISFRMNLTALFKSQNWNIVEAENGQKGLQNAQQIKPDVIISDVKMPIMDGITMLKKLKQIPEIASIPVFIITNLQEEITTAVSNGAEEGILKSSVEPGKLVETISTLFKEDTPRLKL